MPALIIAQLTITDPLAFEEYRAAVPPVIAQYGGRYLVRGGAIEVLEGEWTMPRLVVIAFDDVAAARRFYQSPEYQKILPLRLKASSGNVIIIEGVAP